MNKQLKTLFVLAFAMVMSVTSCLNENEDTNSGAAKLPSNVASLADQVEAMISSVVEIEAIQSSLTEMSDLQATASHFETCAAMIEEHIASIESGVTGVPAVVAAMNIQSKVAAATGALKVDIALLDMENAAELQSALLSIENGVKSWLGKDFKSYFEVSSEAARLGSMINIVEEQSLSADAMMSDVEAGLRVGDATEDLKALIATVGNTSDALTKLNDKMVSLCTEVEGAYMSFFNAETDSKENLKTVNTKAGEAVKSSSVTLTELLARVVACETAIGDIKTRLIQVETTVAGLLAKIQSLTFLSEYSEDYVVAYYRMGDEKVNAPGEAYDGKNKRTPVNNIELNYMVRPAAAASAVTKDVVSVVGYYADQIQTKVIDPSKFVNFTVNGVSVTNAERGIVTVTVNHDLNDDFYYRQTGAKCALFIATGQTDVSSKFVELYPKDNSNTVYVEGIKINTDDFEIDEGQTKNLTATVNPSSATNKTIKWTSSNTEIATIDQNSGVLTAVKQGNVTITATTNGTDEWGDNLTASVNVKVNPSIRLGGPLYVEVGKNAELSLDFPPAMNVESKVWLSSDETKATVENGIVTGVAHTYNQYTYQYNPVTITCIVNGNITLTHEISVVVPQPRQIKLNNYGDDVKSISMKLDQSISLAGSILPANVDASLFRMTYESDGGLGWIDFSSGEIKSPGSIGGRYVYIKVKDIGKNTYMKTFVERTVIVNVEPYYVQTMKFAQKTITLAPGQTTVLSPVFTSDVDGKQPSYTSLNWVSSNPSVVSVNSTTGEISTLKEGSAVITATTTDSNAVPSGQSAKSASCTVVVETPVAPINIGDYFYSDGTWSSQRDNSKTVIGIVFSNAGVATSDPILMRDCPKATHGLVVGLTEYNSTLGQFGYSYVYTWLTGAGYPAMSVDVPNGYGLTKGMTAYRDANSSYVELYDKTSGPLAKHNVALPSGVSSWYIPSYKEMQWLHANKSAVNESLQKAGGTKIEGSLYWLSTLRTYNSYNECQGSPFDMVNGGWYSYDKKTTSYPVRVVFAF